MTQSIVFFSFANEYILQIHINSRHRKAPNVCHVCAKAIRSNQSFEKHVRSHFEDSGPRIKCPREDCDSWLKDDENLKQHLRRFHCADQSLECPKCGRFCKSKHCLSNHLKKTHSTEVFTCEECQKTFKSAKSLKVFLDLNQNESRFLMLLRFFYFRNTVHHTLANPCIVVSFVYVALIPVLICIHIKRKSIQLNGNHYVNVIKRRDKDLFIKYNLNKEHKLML